MNPKVFTNPRMTRKIMDLVCSHFGVTEAELLSETKTHAIVKPRYCAYWLLFHYDIASTSAIGRVLNRTPAGVYKGIQEAQNAIDTQSFIYEDVQALEGKLKLWLDHPWHKRNKVLPDYTMKSLLDQKVNKHLTAA